MKKLLFALAGAASFAALAADPAAGANDISIVGFENYTADQTVIGYGDDGESGSSLWTATGDDASLVKTYGGDNAAAPNIKEPAPFDGAAENTKYLALDTNGSELQRAIPAAGQTIAADGTYIDTLVQFTPSESAPTSTDLTGAKLAIWLGVVENVTNLYVQGGFLMGPVAEGTPTIDTTATQAYKLGNIHVEPGQWHRLTVKAIKLDDDGAGNTISGFQILVDGTLAVSDTAVADAAGIQYYTDFAAEAGVFPGAAGLLTAKTIIPSCAGVIADATLTSVGFKGTGALDDFVVTTAAPDFTPAAIDFSLTWPAGLTASYQIGNGEPVSLANETSPFSVPGLAAGDVVKLIVQNADGATKTLTGTAGTDTALDATGTTFGWPEYLGEAVNGAYTIDDANDLDMLRKGVAANIATVGETFKQTANIDMTSAGAFAGIGAVGQENDATLTALAFEGTYDGGNYTISNITFTNRKGSGLFNLVRGATIKDLVIDTVSYEAAFAAQKLGGAMFVGNGVNCTLQHLVALGSNGLGNPCTYNAAGIANRLEGRGGPVLVIGCTNSAAIYCVYSKVGGICPIVQGADQTVTFVDCANTGAIVADGTPEQITLSGKTPGTDGAAGILAYSQGGNSGDISLTNCVNTGTITGVNGTTIGTILGKMGSSGIVANGGSAQAAIASVGAGADKVSGIKFATVDNGVASFVADDALALNGSYKVMSASATATFAFAEAGTIAFDTALFTPTFAITAAQGLTLSDATSGTVTTYTAAAAGGADYKVTIGEGDVVITPTAEDLAAFQQAGIDTSDVAAVNAALDTVITNGVKVWEALFLGLPPTEAGLESFKIDSITVGTDGNVTVALPAGVDPKTGRGVTITLKLMGSDDLSTWTQIETAGGTDNKTFAPVAPASGETKKFYKVVVEYAGSQN